jgi:hypothetical protein
MGPGLDSGDATLADELLLVYRRALRERRAEVAECLLRGLEKLAASQPASNATLDQAYLLLSGESRVGD